MQIDPIRGSIWRSNINTFLGCMLIASCALWAVYTILHTATAANLFTHRVIEISSYDLTTYELQSLIQDALHHLAY